MKHHGRWAVASGIIAIGLAIGAPGSAQTVARSLIVVLGFMGALAVAALVRQRWRVDSSLRFRPRRRTRPETGVPYEVSMLAAELRATIDRRRAAALGLATRNRLKSLAAVRFDLAHRLDVDLPEDRARAKEMASPMLGVLISEPRSTDSRQGGPVDFIPVSAIDALLDELERM